MPRMTLFFLFCFLPPLLAQTYFPDHHMHLKEPITFSAMQSFLQRIDRTEGMTVTTEGQSADGHPIYLVHVKAQKEPLWKVFFFAQQHGDEPAGKDAILYLLRDIEQGQLVLPDQIELWLVPMVNPDGAMADKRRNGNDQDLNRDHILLSQPETQTIHRIFRRIMPHVAVDCHEFGRDSQDYLDRGWLEWPHIMMDCANHPFFDARMLEMGKEWVERVSYYMNQSGHHYTRYTVGGVPPLQEQRYSTTELNDGRNSLGAFGGLSFIIESGRLRNADPANKDLGKRVDAYLALLKTFLTWDANRLETAKAIKESRAAAPMGFLPTNCFWGSHGYRLTPVRVISLQTRDTEIVMTPNFMHDLVVKYSVPTPAAYYIPAEFAASFTGLFDRHGIKFERLTESRHVKVEPCQLLRVETEFDPVYQRYDGRQITQYLQKEIRTFAKGSLSILVENLNGRRAALLLEPGMMYGLYQYDEFRKLIQEDGVMPVYRQPVE